MDGRVSGWRGGWMDRWVDYCGYHYRVLNVLTDHVDQLSSSQCAFYVFEEVYLRQYYHDYQHHLATDGSLWLPTTYESIDVDEITAGDNLIYGVHNWG